MQPFLHIGSELAGYRVEALIGRGGMAVVYRAEDLRLGRKVALKLLAPELSSDLRFRQRFSRESRLAASIDHPNILPIYEAGEADGVLYLVMRYVVGFDLKVLLEREGPLEPMRALALFGQVASALDMAHAHGLVHRDVKPGNILVASGAGPDYPDHVYLTDFGLTKRSTSQSGITTAGHFLGTVSYVSPEQISGKPVSNRTDVYSLGCVVYEALTGTLPFEREEEVATLWAHLVEPSAPASTRRSDLPPALDAVLSRALAKLPEERWPSCREFIGAIHQVVAGPASQRSGTQAVPAPSRPAEVVMAEPAAAAEPAGATGPVRSGPVQSGPAAPSRPGRSSAAVEAPAPAPPSAPPRRRPRAKLVLAVALPLLVLAAAGGWLLLQHGSRDRLSRHYTASTTVPASFSYPGSWHLIPHAGQVDTLAPYDASPLGTVGNWSLTSQLLKQNPNKVVGMFMLTRSDDGYAITDPNAVKLSIEEVLTSRVTVTTSRASQLDGFIATELEGDAQPEGSGSGARLHFLYVDAQVNPQGPATLHLVFFSAPSTFARNRPLFERILDTVHIDRSLL
jgi:serine/threonine-protein kinase